jgi:hypothetical protein
MTPQQRKAPPVIPLFVFAAIDLVLALLLLVSGGFSLAFVLVAAIGIGLAVWGWLGLQRLPPRDQEA